VRLWALSFVVGIGVAHADAPPWMVVPDAAQNEANAFRTRGDELFAAHSYEEAAVAYTESLELWNNPITRLQLAITFLRLDRYVAAADELESASQYGDAPFTPEQRNELQSYKKLVAGSIGTIEVNCSQANASLSLDGKPWFTCPSTQSRRVDVGDHVIAASQRGYHARSQTVRIIGGSTTRIHVDLRSYNEAYETQHRFPTWLPPSLVGAGAAAMIVGLLVARSGWSKMNEYDQRVAAECSINGCNFNDPSFADLDDLRDSADFRDKAGTWTMLGGAAVLATGVILYLTNTETRRLRVDASPTSVAATASLRF
jgi:tetratricopeptide (TPR) repeat protein